MPAGVICLLFFFFMKTLLISIFSKQGKGKKGKKKGKRGKKDKDLTADRWGVGSFWGWRVQNT